MTSSVDVLAALDGLPAATDHVSFTARRLQVGGVFRVARTVEDGLALIVSIRAPREAIDIRLPYFRARMHVRASIREPGAPPLEEQVCILEVLGRSAADPRAFAAVCAAVVDTMGDLPSPQDLPRIVDSLVELFMPSSAGRGSALGLWGELVTILAHSDPKRLVQGWHVDPLDRFDFALEGVRLEVKTTQSDARVHEFDGGQITGVESLKIGVVSIVTTRTDAGTSLWDLVEELDDELRDRPEMRIKVHRVVSETIGLDWVVEATMFAWDRDYALETARLIELLELPEIDFSTQPRVVGVRARIDCSGLGTPWLDVAQEWISPT